MAGNELCLRQKNEVESVEKLVRLVQRRGAGARRASDVPDERATHPGAGNPLALLQRRSSCYRGNVGE